jgi:iron complex transport system substrate-binding protein
MTRYRESFTFLGDILGRKQQAALLSGFVTKYLDPIRKRAGAIPGKDRVRVYYAENPDGLGTNPSGSIHTQILDFAGAVNVANVTNVSGEGMSQVSMEQLLIWQPRIILVWTPGADRLTTYNAIVNNPLWNRLDAVMNKRVYQIPWLPFSWFDRPPGSNRIIGTIWLANLLYPHIFKYDMVKVTQEYFLKFYHYRLPARDAARLLSPVPPATHAL